MNLTGEGGTGDAAMEEKKEWAVGLVQKVCVCLRGSRRGVSSTSSSRSRLDVAHFLAHTPATLLATTAC